MKIKVSEVDKMIKEEFQKMLGKKKLTSRLSQINEELNKMTSEDSALEEVEAGEKVKTKSAGWSGPEGDVKWAAKFEKKGSHLKEDGMSDEMGGEPSEAGNEIGGEMGNEMGNEMEVEMGEFEAKFAEIGRAIDAKLSAEAGIENGSSEENADIENGSSEETAGEDMEIKTGDSDDEFEEVEVEPSDTEEIEEIVVTKESVDEPIEGHSVSQETTADTVNDNMEKDTHVKESENKKGTVITEVKISSGKNIFTEGIDEKKKTAMLEEFSRMKKFAGLSKDEE